MNLKFINIKNLIPYTFITISNISWFIFGLGKAEMRLLKLDQKIMLLTSSKMHYFDINTFEAAWNHHTPPIFYIFKLVFLFSEFINIDFGFYIVYSFLLLLINLLLFNIVYIFTKNTLISVLLSSAYILDLSSATLGGNIIFDNRTIGMFFQCLIILFAYRLLLNETITNIMFIGTVIFFQVLFLESYFVSCGLLFLYLFKNLHNKLQFLKYIFYINISLLLIVSMFFWQRSELIDMFYLNYVFHYDGIGIGSNINIRLSELLNFGLFYHGSYNRISHAITFVFIILFLLLKNKMNISKESIQLYTVVIVLFFSEILHLFLTGPRFVNYLQIVLLPQYLIIFVFIFFIFKSLNLNILISNIFISSLLLIMFFVFQYGDVVYHRTSLLDQSYLNVLEPVSQESKISSFLFNPGEPELILSWISNESWDDVYFKANKLPSTRMWWWFEMKFVEDYYEWNPNRYYSMNLDQLFFEDLKKENPKYAIIENNYNQPPIFFLEHINENYVFYRTIEKFDVYKLNS